MKKKFLSVITFMMMVAALCIPTLAFADTSEDVGDWSWADDNTYATLTLPSGGTVDIDSDYTEPNCENDGYWSVEYTTGGQNYHATKKEEDSATGHDWTLKKTTLVQGQGLTGYWECSSCNAAYSDNTMNLIDKSTADATCWKEGTITKEGNVTGPDGETVRIEGTRVDPAKPAHLDKDADLIAEVPATCESDGVAAHWYCDIDQKYFMEDGEEIVEVSADDIVIPKTGHKFEKKNAITYEWNKINSGDNEGQYRVTAKAHCDVCGNVQSLYETVVTTSEVAKAPTCATPGDTKYTATFTNELYKTQTKTVVGNIPVVTDKHDWNIVYNWDRAGASVTGVAVCRDCEKGVQETVHPDSAWDHGVLTLTAKFTKEPLTVQTKVIEVKNPMVVKAKTVKAKANKKTVITPDKAFKVTGAEGDVDFKKLSGNDKIKVAKDGKVTVKKGLKKGKTYKVKVRVSASGNDHYMAGTQDVVLKVKIKK